MYEQLSNNSCFLPVHLADEALLLLNDTRLHVATLVACLQHLKVAGTSFVTAAALCGSVGVPSESKTRGNESLRLVQACQLCNIGPDSTVLHLTQSISREHKHFDWTSLRHRMVKQDTLLSREITAMTKAGGSNGFMVRSQLSEFVSRIQGMYYEPDGKSGQKTRLRTSFELFHKTLVKLGTSIGLK